MEKKLLDSLLCPVCKNALSYETKTTELICSQCALAYPIRDGIPVMLRDEARKLSAESTGSTGFDDNSATSQSQ